MYYLCDNKPLTGTQNTTYTTEKLEENKQTQTWVSSQRKKVEVCDTFLAICELSWASILTKLPQSHQECWLMFSRWPTRLESTHPSSHCSPLPTALFCRLSFFLPGFFCQLMFISFNLPVSWEISHASLLCGFRVKTDKGIFRLTLNNNYTTNAQYHVPSDFIFVFFLFCFSFILLYLVFFARVTGWLLCKI